MRTRLGFLLIAATLPLALTACGSSDGAIAIGKSSEVTTTTTGIADDDTTTIPGDTEATTDDTTTGTTDDSTTDGTTAEGNETIPDFGNLPEGVGDCVAVAQALSSLQMATSGEALSADIQKEIDAAAASLPASVRKDFEALLDAYQKFSQGDIGAANDALNDPDLEAASQRLTEYVQKICTGG